MTRPSQAQHDLLLRLSFFVMQAQLLPQMNTDKHRSFPHPCLSVSIRGFKLKDIFR